GRGRPRLSLFFFSSRRRHTRFSRDWSSDVCSNSILMTGLMNPMGFQIDEENLNLIYKQPYSDLYSLPKEKLDELKKNKDALLFGHSLSDQIGGQLAAGFMLTDMYEDDWGGESK